MAFVNKDKNIVEFGLSNVKYAVLAYTAETKTYTIGDIKDIPGAVDLSMPASGDSAEFYADDTLYWSEYSNTGYEGTISFARIPDEFSIDVLGFEQDANGAIFEKSNAVVNEIAMWFQFAGDKNHTKHCFLRCSVSRPDIAGKTTEKTKSPNTSQLKIKAMPRLGDYRVRAKQPDDGSEAYINFDTKLPEPAAASGV